MLLSDLKPLTDLELPPKTDALFGLFVQHLKFRKVEDWRRIFIQAAENEHRYGAPLPSELLYGTSNDTILLFQKSVEAGAGKSLFEMNCSLLRKPLRRYGNLFHTRVAGSYVQAEAGFPSGSLSWRKRETDAIGTPDWLWLPSSRREAVEQLLVSRGFAFTTGLACRIAEELDHATDKTYRFVFDRETGGFAVCSGTYYAPRCYWGETSRLREFMKRFEGRSLLENLE